jgi:hydroxylysine kinase
MDAAALAVFEAPGRVLTPAEAQAAATQVFGISGAAEALYGECDQNFRLTTSGGETFLLKISHAAEDPVVTDLQTQILAHLAGSTLPVPRLMPALADGALQTRWPIPGGEVRTTRLMSFLPGAQFGDRVAGHAELRIVGAALAGLDLALAGFRHPAEDRDLLWDIQSVLKLRPMLQHVTDAREHALAAAALDWFEAQALPKLPGLRRQVIHNDINRGNVLLDAAGQVTGLIDFGDALMAPLIQDLAVCGAYHVCPQGNPMADVDALVAGYAAVLPLEPDELGVLPPMKSARLAMSMLIASWRATFNPDTDTQTTSDRAVAGLALLLDRAKASL